jgi:hypothetical protein
MAGATHKSTKDSQQLSRCSKVLSFAELIGSTAKLDDSLATMQATGKVNKEADSLLDKIISFVTRREQLWLEGEPAEKAFAPYHAWRNLRLIFSKMRTRLAEAQVVGDNPLVVDQAREVISKVLPILSTLAALESEPSDEEAKRILEQVRHLRATSRRMNMTPPPAEEIKEVDQKELVRALDSLLTPMAKVGQS